MEVATRSTGPSESHVAVAHSTSPSQVAVAQSASPGQMFHNATGFGIHGGQFMSVQGNVNIQPTVPPTALPAPQAPQTMVPNIPSTRPTVYSESGNYSNQLLCQGRGFPLYVPKPQRNLPAEYRRRGVAIGDVGTITSDGIFDFFFNIYLPAGHRINAHTPKDFVPLLRYLPEDVIDDDFDPGGYVSSSSIHEIKHDFPEPEPGGEFIFNCRGPNGAVLALPHGAHLKKLQSIAEMRQYAKTHAESWYKHVNGTTLSGGRARELANGSLYLVTGWEKAKSWGIATFHDVFGHNDHEFQLSFAPTADADHGHRYRWHAPYCRVPKYADPPPVDGTPLNQTTFIHAFAISLSETLWGTVRGDVEISQLADSSPFADKSSRGFVPYGSQGSSFVWSVLRGIGTGGGKQCSGETPVFENVIISDASPILQVFHPSQIIHERLRREAPQAAVVITHDDDWRDSFRGDVTGKNRSELQQAIFDRFEITEEDGIVFLRAKSESTELKTDAISPTPDIDLGDKPPPKETENCLDVSSAQELIVPSMNSIGLPPEAPSPNEKPALRGISGQTHDGRSFQAEEESTKRESSTQLGDANMTVTAEEESIKRGSSTLDELRAQLGSGSMTVTPPLHVPAVFVVSPQGNRLPLEAQLDTEEDIKAPPPNFVPLNARLAAHDESLQLESRSRSDGTSPISPVEETLTEVRQQPRTGPSSSSNLDPHSRFGVVSTQSQSSLLSPFDDLSIQDKASDQQSQYNNSDTRPKFSWDLYTSGSSSDHQPLPFSSPSPLRMFGQLSVADHRLRPEMPPTLHSPYAQYPPSNSGGTLSPTFPLDETRLGPEIPPLLSPYNHYPPSLSPTIPLLTFSDCDRWAPSFEDNSGASSPLSPLEHGPRPLLFDTASLFPRLVFHSEADHSTFGSQSRTQSDMMVATEACNDRLAAPPRPHGDGGRRAARLHRRQQASPYLPPRTWSDTPTLVAESVCGDTWANEDSMFASLVVDAGSASSSSLMSRTVAARAPTTWSDATTLRAESVGGDKWADEDSTIASLVVDAGSASSSSLMSRNIDQFSQEEQQEAQSAPGYRSLVASPATRRAANRRRKDPNKPGAHVCQYCGSDFTARHNLKLHLKSHLSIKEHECERCAKRFSTPQTLQRHKRSSACPVSSGKTGKKRKV